MHTHAPPASLGTAFAWGVGLNLAYVGFEAGAGLYIGSLALLSDAGHNLSDVVSLVLVMVGFRLAKRKPTATFTYGFGKGTVLISLFNALLLLVGMGAVAYGAVERLLSHPALPEGAGMAWVAGIGIAVNGGSALLFFRHQHHELNAKGAFLHLAGDAAVSAAVMLAGIVLQYKDWPWLDPAVSLAVAALVVAATWGLLRDSLRLSLDGVPLSMDVPRLESLITQVDGVAGVHHLHVWPLSTTQAGLTAHILTQEADLARMEQIKAAIKHVLQHAGIPHATLEFELPGGDCQAHSHRSEEDHHEHDRHA